MQTLTWLCGLTLLFSHTITFSQEDLRVEGSAIVTGTITSEAGLNGPSLFIDGAAISQIRTTNSSNLKLIGNNPMLEFQRITGNTALAFMQSFGDDFFVANRLNGNLIFRTNNLNRILINGSGDVLVRSASRLAEVTLTHANGDGASNGVAIEHSGTNNSYWTFYASNADGNLELYYQGTQRGEFNSTSGAYTTISDRRLKSEIKPLYSVLHKIGNLKPSSYFFNGDHFKRSEIGFIAQEVLPVFPELVNQSRVGDSDEQLFTPDYAGFGVIAIAALQELMVKAEMENK